MDKENELNRNIPSIELQNAYRQKSFKISK